MTPGRFVALERMTIERLPRASPIIDPGIPRMNPELAWIRPWTGLEGYRIGEDKSVVTEQFYNSSAISKQERCLKWVTKKTRCEHIWSALALKADVGLLSFHIAALMIGVQRAISLLTSAASGC